MSALKFRNLEASPDDPVETWPFEGVLAAIERGTLPDWQRLASAIDEEPWGRVARYVDEALQLSRPYGITVLMEKVIERSRAKAVAAERDEVKRRLRTLVGRSGLSRREYATRIGTSTSRLASYLSGKVVPSAALVVRMETVTSLCARTDTACRDVLQAR